MYILLGETTHVETVVMLSHKNEGDNPPIGIVLCAD